MSIIQSVRGTKDVLPEEASKWQVLEANIRDVSHKFGYQELRTPIFEKTEVFARGVGDGTDIVNKEMYTFDDRGGESLTLRPEQTAALVRSVIQNNLLVDTNLLRLFYIGSYFRYERPQKGRLREFHQYGAELINSPNPESDVEIILLAINFIKQLGIRDYKLKINSLGNDVSRNAYKQALVQFLSKNKDKLSKDSQARMDANPLRVLDSKDEIDLEIVANAPTILNYFDEESDSHFNSVREFLDSMEVNYEVFPTLVRGLDYYSHTVFEFQNTAIGAQNAFGGGGRYNKLFSELGGKEVPAVGFAMGLERILLILEQIGYNFPQRQVDVSIITASQQCTKFAMQISQLIRDNMQNICLTVDMNRRSMKSQLRESSKLSAKLAVIIGETECQNNSVTIKFLQEEKEQITIKTPELIALLTSYFK